MNCEQRQDQILLLAANQLDDAEANELRAHLDSGCAVCNRRLSEANDLLGDVLASVPPVVPSASTKQRLMQQITREIAAPATRSTQQRARMVGYVVAASVGLVLGMLIMYSRLGVNQNQLRELQIALQDSKTTVADLQRMLGSTQTRLVELQGEKSQARLLWDKEGRKWYLYTMNVPPPPAGRTYELWFIPPNSKPVRAGEFETDKDGKGMLVVNIPEGMHDIAVAAVTEEPAGGVDQPTTKPFLVADLTKVGNPL